MGDSENGSSSHESQRSGSCSSRSRSQYSGSEEESLSGGGGRRRRRRARDVSIPINDGSLHDNNNNNSRESFDSRSRASGDDQSYYSEDGSRSYYSEEGEVHSGGSSGSQNQNGSVGNASRRDEHESVGSHSRESRSFYHEEDRTYQSRSEQSGSSKGSRSYYSDEERSRSSSGSERSSSSHSRGSFSSRNRSTLQQSHDGLSVIEENSKSEQSIFSAEGSGSIQPNMTRRGDSNHNSGSNLQSFLTATSQSKGLDSFSVEEKEGDDGNESEQSKSHQSDQQISTGSESHRLRSIDSATNKETTEKIGQQSAQPMVDRTDQFETRLVDFGDDGLDTGTAFGVDNPNFDAGFGTFTDGFDDGSAIFDQGISTHSQSVAGMEVTAGDDDDKAGISAEADDRRWKVEELIARAGIAGDKNDVDSEDDRSSVSQSSSNDTDDHSCRSPFDSGSVRSERSAASGTNIEAAVFSDSRGESTGSRNGSFSGSERSRSLSPGASMSRRDDEKSWRSGSFSGSERSRSLSPDASMLRGDDEKSRRGGSFSGSDRNRSLSPEASVSKGDDEKFRRSGSFSGSEISRSLSPDQSEASATSFSHETEHSSRQSGSFAGSQRSISSSEQYERSLSQASSSSRSRHNALTTGSYSQQIGSHSQSSGTYFVDETESSVEDYPIPTPHCSFDKEAMPSDDVDPSTSKSMNDSSAGSSYAESFATESFANESVTELEVYANAHSEVTPKGVNIQEIPSSHNADGYAESVPTTSDDGALQKDPTSDGVKDAYDSDEEDSFFERSLIAREPDMLPKITEHSNAEKSDYDGSDASQSESDDHSFESKKSGDDGEKTIQTEEGTIKSLQSFVSAASRRRDSVNSHASVQRSVAESIFSGVSGINTNESVDVSVVSDRSSKSRSQSVNGRLMAQKNGYSRDQMKKLRLERQGARDRSLPGVLGRDDAIERSIDRRSRSVLERKRRRGKVQGKSDALLELVANVSQAMEEIEADGIKAEEKDTDIESSAKRLLNGFESLVGIVLQFSDELELMSTFDRRKEAASVDALQSLINFAPMIDDVFVELKPILQKYLVENIDEEMNDLLYGMNLIVDLLCEMTHLVGERQEWNIRANTSYVTLLELLSRDALEIACIFDDIDTPEYELTKQIEDAWANTGHEEEFKTLQVTTDLTVFRQICYDVTLSMDSWCPDVDTLMDVCGIDDMMLETETVEDHPDDRMFETPETALQVLEKVSGDGLPRFLSMARIMRRIMPTDFITDQKLRENIHTLKGSIRDQLGLPVSNLIAISSVPEVLNEQESLGIAGVGKTTLAAKVANHPDTRKFFNDGIAWIHIGQKEMTYTRYIQCLRELMAQIDIGDDEEPLFPELLHVPCESQAKRRRREEGFMMYAREIMVDFLQFRNVLIILDDICFEPDLDWFDFDPAALQTAETDDEFSCVILVTTRCRNLLPAADTIEVDMLKERSATKLLIQESGDLASSLGASSLTRSVVKECAHHPLAVKSVGRWLNLKHATAGASSSREEMRQDVINSMEMILKSANQEDADMMYEILNMSLSPAINGQPTNIIKFCFAAFVLVFCDKNQISDFALADATPIIPLSIAETLFEALLELEEQTLLHEGSLFYAQKKEAAVLIPEALSALGVLKVIITFTEVEPIDEDVEEEPREIEEKYLQVMHAVQEEYGEYLYKEETSLAELTKDAQERWNRVFGLAYISNAPEWATENPDAGVDYAFEMLPAHLTLGGLYNEGAELLSNGAFVRGRLFALGRENGTRRHIKDCEALFERMVEKRIAGKGRFDPRGVMKKSYEVLAGLMNMDEDEYIAQEGSTEALEVARAHSEIAFSLAEKQCWDAAVTHWETSQELLVQSLGMVELVACIQFNLGVIYAEMNAYEQALNAMKQCLKIRGAIHGEEHILYAQTIQKLGDIFLKMSDYHEAMESYTWALDRLHIEPEHHRIDIGDILENMGSIHYSKGEIEEALQCYQDALRSKEIHLGEDHPELSTTFQFIGNCLSDQGKTEESIAHYEEAIRLKQMDGEGGGERDADILTMKGVLHNLSGRQQDGLECYEEALKILVTKVPHRKEKVASLLHLIGCVYLMSGEHNKAMKLFEESLQAKRKVLGFVHLDVASTLFNMAFLHQSRNRLDKALKCLEEALKIRQLRLPDSEKVAITHEKIGTLARSIGKTKKAELAFNEALRIRKLIHGQRHEAVAAVLQELGDLMDDLGEYDEAMKHYVEALDIRQNVFGPDDLAVAETLYSMGFSLQNNGAIGRALQCFEESLSIRKFQLGDDSREVGDTLNMMGSLHAQRGELEDALTLLWDALRVRKLKDDHMKVSETLKNLGNVHREKQEYELAIECYEECLRIRRATVGEDHEKVADAFIAIGNVQSDLDLVDDAIRSYEKGTSLKHYIFLLTDSISNLCTVSCCFVALRIRTVIHGEQDESVAAVLQYMGTLEFRAEQLDRALQLLNEFIRIREDIGTEHDGDHVNVLFMVGNIYKLRGDDFEAQRCWTEAYKVFRALGLADPKVAAVMEQLVGASDSHREPSTESYGDNDNKEGGFFGKLAQKLKVTQRTKNGKGQQL